jgi:hypothetical protein
VSRPVRDEKPTLAELLNMLGELASGAPGLDVEIARLFAHDTHDTAYRVYGDDLQSAWHLLNAALSTGRILKESAAAEALRVVK